MFKLVNLFRFLKVDIAGTQPKLLWYTVLHIANNIQCYIKLATYSATYIHKASNLQCYIKLTTYSATLSWVDSIIMN